MTVLKTRALPCLVAAIGLVLLCVIAGPQILADGAAPTAGFDGFETPDDGSTTVDLSAFGLPASIPLKGVPLHGGAGNADTIVARTQTGPADGATSTIDIELVALHLVSSAPVDLTPLGGPFVGVLSDLHITIDASDRFFTAGAPFPDGTGAGPSVFNLPVPDAPLPPSIGRMRIDHDNPDKTFSSCFGEVAACAAEPACITPPGIAGGGIFADAIFTTVGGDPSDPMDVHLSMPAPAILLASTGEWIHFEPGGMFPSGDFSVDDILHCGPHPPIVVILAVELNAFRGTATPGSVALQWSTASEQGHEGFDVLRGTSPDGSFRKINARMIPALGGPATGAVYDYADTTAKPGATYYYKLRDTDTQGASTLHGTGACNFGAAEPCEPLRVSVPANN